MKTPVSPVVAIGAIMLSSALTLPAAAQDAMQWTEAEGGNGHWYLLATDAGHLTWTDAQAFAESVGGHLVTVTSAEESTWVKDELDGSEQHLGAYQDIHADDYSEPDGGWRWVTGEPWGYENWQESLFDNDGVTDGPAEEFAHFCCGMKWNDIGVTTRGLIIEWSADCNGDGIVDYGQILDGTFSDDDNNGVPDCCDDTTCLATVQWRAEDGGNGHWYMAKSVPKGIAWLDADQAARSVGGYLATLTDSTEDQFVAFTIADPEIMWAPPAPGEAGGIKGPWVGGQRREVDCDLAAMVWVTGETWDYTRWHPGTPSEDCTSGLQLWDRTGQRAWVDNEDDDPTRSVAYIIEWSADCNGDGIVDYGQILDGTFSDDDGNGVPDCCDMGMPSATQWKIEEGGNGHWYSAVCSLQTWADSRQIATSHGGHLVSITSEAENLHVESVRNGIGEPAIWIGLVQNCNEEACEPGNGWGWVTGEPLNYENWDDGNPNNSDDADVAEMCCGTDKWNDRGPLNSTLPYLIEWSADCNGDGIVDYGQILDGTFSDDDKNGVPDCCDQGIECAAQWKVEDGGNGHWYQRLDSNGNWLDCRSEALARGADLVSVLSSAEHEFMGRLIEGESYEDLPRNFWLGGRSTSDGNWIWSDGSEWQYQNWCEGSPNTGSPGHTFLVYYIGLGNCWDDYLASDAGQHTRGAVIEWSADCNGDGIVDYGQILDGTLPDDDGDGIPNPCDQPGGFDGILDVPSEYATIQEAVLDCPEGGTILIGPGTYTSNGGNVITLQGRSVTIVGSAGAEQTFIDGENTRRGLAADGEGNNGTVIDGLTFMNGRAVDGAGASFRNCTPDIRNCVFLENNANSFGLGGGLLLLNAGDALVTNCEFIGNTARGYGGGILSNEGSSPLISDCLFDSNSVSGTTNEGFGGGLHCSNSPGLPTDGPTIRNCTFVNNSASPAGGGGISAWPNIVVDISECTFESNTADTNGGGIYMAWDNGGSDTTEVTISDTNFTGNSANKGGAAYSSNGSSDFAECEFSGNEASAVGGALYLAEGTDMGVQNCLFTENTAPQNGTSIWSKGHNHDDLIANCIFYANENTSANGGVYLLTSSPTIENCDFIENSADYGSGITSDFAGNPIVRNCRFLANTATSYGAGIWSYQSSPQIIDCEFLGNTNDPAYEGAAVRTYEGATSIGDTRFCNNSPTAIYGPYTDTGGNLFEESCEWTLDCNEDGILDSIQILNGSYSDINDNDVLDTCEPIQWRAEDGGNDHWYQLNRSNLTWVQARIAAEDAGGLLASVLSDEEHAFIANIVPYSSWLGGNDIDQEGVWEWVSDEPWGYTRWGNSEPNNNGNEDALYMTGWKHPTSNGLWYDGPSDSDINVMSFLVEWSADCNEDGIIDYGQILDGTFADCNGNGIPDTCELTETLTIQVDRTPTSPNDFIVYDFSEMSDALEDVTLDITARGEFDAPNEWLYVYFETTNTPLATPFATDGADCVDLNDSSITISAADWNAAMDDGVRQVYVSALLVDPDLCENPFVRVTAAVSLSPLDCNNNGTWDACEIADGSVDDSDGDGLMDECDGCADDPFKTEPGTCGCGVPDEGDADEDGILDCVDACPNWPHDCSEDGQTLFVAVDQSIQQAVDAVPSGGTIEIIAGTFPITSTIDPGGKAMTIRGTTDTDGNPTTVLDGQDSVRIAICQNGEGSDTVFENLVFTNGSASTGGGLYNSDSSPRVVNCVFSFNASNADGGAMYNKNCSSEIINCIFLSNTASTNGGAMANESSMPILTDCMFDSNTSQHGGGGVLNFANSAPILNGCSFSGNQAGLEGGGMYNVDSNPQLTGCSFTSNTATTDGGAISASDSEITLNSCDLIDNSAFGQYAGAIFSDQSVLLILDCDVRSNTCLFNGGAIYNTRNATFNASGTTFEANESASEGGSLWFGAGCSGVIDGCNFLDNIVNGGNGDGGAVWSTSANITMTNSVFEGNTASDEGSAFFILGSGGIVSLSDSRVCGNGSNQITGSYTDLGGNCISDVCDSDEDGTLDCNDGCPNDPRKIDPGQCGCGNDEVDTDDDGIADCNDPCPEWPYDCSEDGQTLYVAVGQSIQTALGYTPDGGTVEIAAGTFPISGPFGLVRSEGEYTLRGAVDEFGIPATILDAEGEGRLLTINNSGAPSATIIENLQFINGNRENVGGAICIGESSDPLIRNCIFENNYAELDGGAIFVRDSAPTFEACTFATNATAADSEGGGVYALNTELTILFCYFIENTAGGGGGLALENCSGSQILGTGFWNNTADLGGGIYLGSSDVSIEQCLIEGNTATNEGGGIHLYLSTASTSSTIICSNTPDQLAGNGGLDDLGDNCILEDCGDDLNGNNIPDACDPDCDQDGLPDDYEIDLGNQSDCNANGIPDDCEIADGLAADCNGNGVPDECDIADETSRDKNANGRPDECDLAEGDLNLDGCINGADLGILISIWGLPNPDLGDFNNDGQINGADLGQLLGFWIANPC